MKRAALALTMLLLAACKLDIAGPSTDAGTVDGGSTHCQPNPCQNGGTCGQTEQGIVCTCAPGYEGERCETNVDDCSPNPCRNAGVCSDRVAGFSCTCAPGFSGKDCSTNIDECVDDPCQNGGTCTDKVNGYQCDCPAGYTGVNCDVNVDDCAPNPCMNGGACVDGVNGFECTCTAGNTGPTCSNQVEICATDTCQNGGTCTDGPDGYTCECLAGYNGVNCENNIDDCASLPCANGGTCTDGVNSFTCDCPSGFSGETCGTVLDSCSSEPCQNGGSCMSVAADYVCSCPAGYKGVNCEVNIDDCASNPCHNGGTCTDLVNDFACACAQGYQGRTCDNNEMTCPTDNPCQNGGSCVDGSNGYSCDCLAGYSGILCETNVDDCDPEPCMHGTCTDGVNSYTCQCDAGYEGAQCQHDINDCANTPCQNGGTCTDLVNGYKCDCVAGWAGDNCDADINECDPNPCLNGGTCTDGLNAYTCACPSGYDGDRCETPINECSLVGVCGHGTCDGNGGCTCDSGWSGTSCDTNVDECATGTPCANGGLCTDTQGSFSCACSTGYAGDTCTGCATGYQDNDEDGVCCVLGYKGAACDVCDDGFIIVDNACKLTCANSTLDCGAHGTCDESGVVPTCTCDQDYYGALCDSLPGTCTDNLCGVHSSCVENASDNTYKCQCESGWTGLKCTDVDECAVAVNAGQTPCQHGGECVDGDGAYTCNCAAGWAGSDCSSVDDCIGNDCQNGATCVDGDNAFTCTCAIGWTGPKCADVDDCAAAVAAGQVPCQNGGQCIDGDGTYTCDCATGWLGADCSEPDNCVGNDCQHGATCVDGDGTFTCTCASGWTGPKCADVNECEVAVNAGQTPCLNGGTCLDGVGAYTCDCPAAWLGADCSEPNDCIGNDCQNGSTCVDGDNTFTCTCTGTWIGAKCDEPDDCAIAVNNGQTPCNGNGTCVDGNNAYTCNCDTGWLGTDCSEPDDCVGNDCQNGALCVDGSGTFTCTCASGWTGPKCADVNECEVAVNAGQTPCLNGGTCVDGVGAYTCDCPAQWLGADCSEPNDCIGNDCQNGSICVDGDNTFTCTCTGTWIGAKCDEPDDCAIAVNNGQTPCNGNGTCVDGNNTYTCDCQTGWLGADCSEPDNCVGNDCLNGATCVDGDGTFSCTCASGWTGPKCADVNECEVAVNAGQTPCLNGGTCVDGVGAYTCDCPAQWLGADCSEPNDCIGNDCQNGSTCVDGDNTFTCTCTGTWIGPKCAEPDDCAIAVNNGQTPCNNGGTCVDGNHTTSCNCAAGWGGATCDVRISCTAGLCGDGTCQDLQDMTGYTCQCPDGTLDLSGDGTSCAQVLSVAAGVSNGCAITTAGSLHCWGDNTYGQLGTGVLGNPVDATAVRTPVRVGSGTGWTHVSVGNGHICGIRDGGLFCWGNDSKYQVGTPFTGAPTQNTPLQLRADLTWTDVSVGDTHSCALAGTALYCWGNNDSGQAANLTFTEVDSPTLVSGTWSALAAGANHTCAIDDTGHLECWGANADGQLGNSGTIPTATPTPVTDPGSGTGVWTAVMAGAQHTCALQGTTAYCWGSGTAGALGNGASSTQTAPVAVSGGLALEALGAGSDFSCGIVTVASPTFDLYCWGDNQENLLLSADPPPASADTPQLVSGSAPLAGTWNAFAVGATHMCGVDSGSSLLYCWGSNVAGELGSAGPDGTVHAPALVKAAAVTHTANPCANNPCHNGGTCSVVSGQAQCDCTGTGFTGSTCSDEIDECAATPTLCGQGSCSDLLGQSGYTCTCPAGTIDIDGTGMVCGAVASIAAGINNTCAITTAKTLHCWGDNGYGQLGLGAAGTFQYYGGAETSQTIRTPLRVTSAIDRDTNNVETTVSDLTDWDKVSIGEYHMCGLRASKLYCWGSNTTGQLGDPGLTTGNGEYFATPRSVDNTLTWTDVSVGAGFSCGIAGGQIYCWGTNGFGELGALTDPFYNSPQLMPLPAADGTSWTALSAGWFTTCAFTDTGNLYCWGDNYYGEAGVGSADFAIADPTQVALATPTAVQVDNYHGCALDGSTAYCWGSGSNGALGTGSNPFPDIVDAPVLVAGGLTFASLALGTEFSCGAVVNGAANDLYCWGINAHDELLTGGGNVNVPTKLPDQWTVYEIGDTHMCGVKQDGLLYCWGNNAYGKLGTAPTITNPPYTQAEMTDNYFAPAPVKAAAVTYP